MEETSFGIKTHILVPSVIPRSLRKQQSLFRRENMPTYYIPKQPACLMDPFTFGL